mmetsp:Transcript_29880/g.79846  ORF Transcript_29880/g.79846 Transcript_29880/m.79846 type:complete len:487 (+) Transcript_29880:182-1642(+)
MMVLFISLLLHPVLGAEEGWSGMHPAAGGEETPEGADLLFKCEAFRSTKEYIYPELSKTSCVPEKAPKRFETPNPLDAPCNAFAKGVDVPSDAFAIQSKVCIDSTTDADYRVIISNGIIDHDIVNNENDNEMCEIPWFVKIPKNPEYLPGTAGMSEVQHLGIIGMAVNGVPFYGPKETVTRNAVEPLKSKDAELTKVGWPGHASATSDWHYHHPRLNGNYPNSTDLVGYALDGFPIYGPLTDLEIPKERSQMDVLDGYVDADGKAVAGILDQCNGRRDKPGGKYQYHLRTEDQVRMYDAYCSSEADGSNAWNYILGCFHGYVNGTIVDRYTDYDLADFVCDGKQESEIGLRATEIGFTVAPSMGDCPPVLVTAVLMVIGILLCTGCAGAFGYKRLKRDDEVQVVDKRLRPFAPQTGAFPDDGVPVTPSTRPFGGTRRAVVNLGDASNQGLISSSIQDHQASEVDNRRASYMKTEFFRGQVEKVGTF